MHLYVVVSQWHDSLVVRCYDFVTGETKEAARLAPDEDALLVDELKVGTQHHLSGHTFPLFVPPFSVLRA